jgi:DNA polymerase-4
MTLRSLFIDFDSFFASVEQHEDARLRGRPVGVVPVMADTTCCIAASYQAKAHGVRTGTKVAEAKRLCPDIVLVHARHGVYIEYHRKLLDAIESCIPIDEVASIDEMACTLTGTWRRRERAQAVAERIKAAVRETAAAVTCSIGIAPNRFLAKTASKMDKPNGVTVIEQSDLPEALYRLPLAALHGVGPRMLARLRTAGITDVPALYAASADDLARVWGGIDGAIMHARLRGAVFSQRPTERATVGHSHVLSPELRRDDLAIRVLHRLLQKAAWRLRSQGYLAGGLVLGLSYVDGRRWRGTRRLDATDDTLAFVRTMRSLWEQRPRRVVKPLKVGVTLIHVTEARGQSLELFAESRDRGRLNATVDALNRRFGAQAVYFGGAHGALDAAPMRIAFTRIPDPVTED